MTYILAGTMMAACCLSCRTNGGARGSDNGTIKASGETRNNSNRARSSDSGTIKASGETRNNNNRAHRTNGDGFQKEAEAMDRLFSGMFPEGEPGGEVLVMIGDEVVFDKGYGLAILPGSKAIGEKNLSNDASSKDTSINDASSKAIDGDTFFNLASCSKQFTAVAVLQLAEKGLISLDDKVTRYFPEYVHPIWNDIRISHLLDHSSGIPDARGYLTREQKVAGDEKLSMEYLTTLDHLNFEPGTAYEYINPTFVLLGALVERVTGMPFTQYAAEKIFTPAGMTSTLYFDRDHQELIPNMAHGYALDESKSNVSESNGSEPDGSNGDSSNGKDSEPDGSKGDGSEPDGSNGDGSTKVWNEYDFGEETFFATRPDGGIYSSAHEIVKWEKALRSGAVLPEEWLQKAWTAHTLVSGSPYSDYQNRPGTYYGYGWFLEGVPETEESEDGSEGKMPKVIYHTGDNGGFKILIARYPESDAMVAILANRADWDRYETKTKVEEIFGLR